MMRQNKLYVYLGRMICFVLTFLLSLLIVWIVFLNMLRLNSVNSNTIKRVLISSDYYNKLYQEIESSTKMYTTSTGLPPEVLEGVFQSEEVQAEVVSYIEATFLGEKYNPNTQKVRERLSQKIDAYLDEMNIRVNSEISENIDEYTTLVAEKYSRSLDLPIIEQIYRMNIDYQILFSLITGVSVLIALLILSLFDRRNPWHRQFIFCLYNSTFSAAIMLAVIPLILLSKQLYLRLQIMPSSLYFFAVDYIKVNLQILVFFGILLGVISIILLLIERVFGAKLIRFVSSLIRQRAK